jgi:hypothetical protein
MRTAALASACFTACALSALVTTAPATAEAAQNLAATPGQIPASVPTLSYVVRPGDSLRSIAVSAFHRVDDYRQVQTLNGITDPLKLRVGMTLHLPVALLRTRPVLASVVSYRGDVSLHQGRTAVATRVGATLGEGAEIETGANTNLRLALPDGGVIAVPSMSRIRLTRLRAYLLNGAVDQDITLLSGRSEFRASPVRAPGGFRVGTPLSASAVRGTEFRVAFNGSADRSSTEVLGGSVHVAPDGLEPLTAPARHGVAIADGRALLVDLLPEPAWAAGNAVQAGADISLAIEPQAGAAFYRAVVASDAGFVNVVAGAESRPGQARIDLYPLPDARYFVRLTAVSPLGVEGMPADHAFVRALNTVSGLSAEPQDGHRFGFFWSTPPRGAETYRFQLSRTDGAVIADQPDLTQVRTSVPNLAAGEYTWRVMARWRVDGQPVEAWSHPRSLSIP